MIVILSLILGAVTGTLVARRRNGNRLDMAQYGAVYAIVFGLIGMVTTLILEKMV